MNRVTKTSLLAVGFFLLVTVSTSLIQRRETHVGSSLGDVNNSLVRSVLGSPTSKSGLQGRANAVGEPAAKTRTQNATTAAANTATNTAAKVVGKTAATIGRQTTAPISIRKKIVLSSSHVSGRAKAAYIAAKASSEILDKLFCYCGCDLSESHNTLLDCFTSEHGAYCDDCQEESIMGNKLSQAGASMVVIQETVDKNFSRHYPFQHPSPRYQRYLDNRLYLASLFSSSKRFHNGGSTTLPSVIGEVSPGKLKLKPGKSFRRCCEAGGGNDASPKKHLK